MTDKNAGPAIKAERLRGYKGETNYRDRIVSALPGPRQLGETAWPDFDPANQIAGLVPSQK